MTDARALMLRAEALRTLAALVRSQASTVAALRSWWGEAPAELAPALRRVARRLDLGAPLLQSVAGIEDELEEDGCSLACLLALTGSLGGDLAGLLDALASTIEERASASREAATTAAGARLSGRMVAALPLMSLAIAPAAHASLTDPIGLVIVAVGVTLALVGMGWIGRLVPEPSGRDDPVASLADLVACGMTAGAPLEAAFVIASAHPPASLGPGLDRFRRLVALGLAAPEALARCGDPDLAALAAALAVASTRGLPVARALRRFAHRRRTDARRSFQLSLRRAPILMVVPLTICVLPSFVLLGLTPFLRGLVGHP